jgi:hypothetical protein
MRFLVLTFIVIVFLPSGTIGAQRQTATVRVQVRAGDKPVEDAARPVHACAFRRRAIIWRGWRARAAADSADGSRASRGH